jgi:hypothetical protein
MYFYEASAFDDHVSRQASDESYPGVGRWLAEVPVNQRWAPSTGRGEGDLSVTADVATVSAHHDRPGDV